MDDDTEDQRGGNRGSCFPNVEPSSFSMLKNVWNIGRVLRVCPASSTLRVVGRVVRSRGGIDVCLIIFARFIRSWTTRWTHVNVYNVLVLLAGSLEIYYLYEED